MPNRPPTFRPAFAPPPAARPSASERGYDRDWQKLRLFHLQQNPICVFHSHPDHKHECTISADVVDHVIPIVAGGGRLDPTNLRSVCRTAHDRITKNLNETGRNELPRRFGFNS